MAESDVCPVCGGTGKELFRDAEGRDLFRPCPACEGGKAQAAAGIAARSGIPYADKLLPDILWDIYKDTQGGVLNLPNQKKLVLSLIERFPEWEQHGLGLYIFSKIRGSGKTMIASVIGNEVTQRYAASVKFLRCADIIDIAKAENEFGDKILPAYRKSRLLILDDLGQKQSGEKWTSDILYDIFDYRMQKNLVTIITSNVPMNALDMDDRIVDRLNRMTQEMPLPEYCVRAAVARQEKRKFLQEMGIL